MAYYYTGMTLPTTGETVTWTLPEATPSAVPNPYGKDDSGKKHRSAPYIHPQRLEGHKEPMKYGGSLDQFKSFDYSPNVGREFPDAKLADWLRAPNSDELIRDLAVLVSQRGVVFFRAQDDMTLALQKELAQRIGLQSGKPPANGLHIFPFVYKMRPIKDDEVTVIAHRDPPRDPSDPRVVNKVVGDATGTPCDRLWHSDAMFEHAPGDYSVLRMEQLPTAGGDTLWASTYDMYDRLSRPVQAFLEGLTFTGGNPSYHANAAKNGIPYYTDPRGAPENVGRELRAVHPVVRTNPVTGWHGLFPFGPHVEFINGVTRAESQRLLDWIHSMAVSQHDLQVRFRWTNSNDMAIWDNRSMIHSTTPDFRGLYLGDRVGYRAMSVGERPYFDPEASGRVEALAREEAEKAEKA